MIDIKVFKKQNYYIVITISVELLNIISTEDKIEVLDMYLSPSWGYRKGKKRFLSSIIYKSKMSEDTITSYIEQWRLNLEKARDLYKSRLIKHIVIE